MKIFVNGFLEGGYFWGFLRVWCAVNLAALARVGQFPVTRRFAGNDFRIATIDALDPALRVQNRNGVNAQT